MGLKEDYTQLWKSQGLPDSVIADKLAAKGLSPPLTGVPEEGGRRQVAPQEYTRLLKSRLDARNSHKANAAGMQEQIASDEANDTGFRTVQELGTNLLDRTVFGGGLSNVGGFAKGAHLSSEFPFVDTNKGEFDQGKGAYEGAKDEAFTRNPALQSSAQFAADVIPAAGPTILKGAGLLSKAPAAAQALSTTTRVLTNPIVNNPLTRIAANSAIGYGTGRYGDIPNSGMMTPDELTKAREDAGLKSAVLSGVLGSLNEAGMSKVSSMTLPEVTQPFKTAWANKGQAATLLPFGVGDTVKWWNRLTEGPKVGPGMDNQTPSRPMNGPAPEPLDLPDDASPMIVGDREGLREVVPPPHETYGTPQAAQIRGLLPAPGPRTKPALDVPPSPGPFEVETLGGTPAGQPQAPPESSLPPPAAADWLASPHDPQQGGASFKPAVSAARLRPEPTPRYQPPAPRQASPQTPLAVPESPGPLELEGGAPTPQPFDPGVAQDSRIQPPPKAQLALPEAPGPFELEGQVSKPEPLAHPPSADLGPFEAQASGLQTGQESLGRVAQPFRPATVAKRVEPPTQGQAFDPGISATNPLPAPAKPSLELPAAPSEMQIERHNPNPRLSREKQSFRNNPEATPSDLRDPVSGAVQKPKAEAPKPKPAVKAEAAREAAKAPAGDFETHLKGARKKAEGTRKEVMAEGMKDAPEYNDAKGAEILKHIKDGKTREEIKAATGLGVKALGKYFSRLFHSGKISLAERKAVQPGWENEP